MGIVTLVVAASFLGPGAALAATGAPLHLHDRAFMSYATGQDLAQLALAELALERAADHEAKGFASSAVGYHGRSAERWQTAAKRLNVKPPTALNPVAERIEPTRKYLHGDTVTLRSWNTCYLTLAPEDLRLRGLVMQLAPAALHPDGISADCWVATTPSARSGRRMHELRLAGSLGQYDGGLPQATLTAVATLPTTYTSGTRLVGRSPVAPTLQALTPPVPAAPAPKRNAVASDKPIGSPSFETSGLGPPLGVSPASPPQARGVLVAGASVPAMLAKSVVSLEASVRIVIHHLEGDAGAEARARQLRERLEAHREFGVELRTVTASVKTDNLRIFFESDRSKALITRELLASGPIPIRDFTDYQPLPRAGTIELWLAATSSPGPAAPRSLTTPPEASKQSVGTTGGGASSGRKTGLRSSDGRRSESETLRLLLLQPER